MRTKILTLAFASLMAASCVAQSIKLPEPSKACKVTLMQALTNRHSTRAFAESDIPDDVLSTILWSACGINRPDEAKITAPSALNAQDIIVFVVRQDGAYRYDPKGNTLTKVSSKDLRKDVAGQQKFAATAPVSLVLVSDHSKFPEHMPAHAKTRMGVVDAGYVSENICLACSALGLSTVPRMTMKSDVLKTELGLDDNYDFIINNQIGYPKK